MKGGVIMKDYNHCLNNDSDMLNKKFVYIYDTDLNCGECITSYYDGTSHYADYDSGERITFMDGITCWWVFAND